MCNLTFNKLVLRFTVYGNTPAHYAAESGHAKCYNCCLQHDANPDLLNEKNETTWDKAKKAGHPLLMQKACELAFLFFYWPPVSV